jgi:hypothetical protein
MDSRRERSLLPLLADELPHHGPAYRETRGQHRVAALLIPIGTDNPLTQVECGTEMCVLVDAARSLGARENVPGTGHRDAG